jgi:hypothetical protein
MIFLKAFLAFCIIGITLGIIYGNTYCVIACIQSLAITTAAIIQESK